MNDYTSKRKREDGQYLPPELVPSSYQRLGMGFRTTPFSSGRFMEAEPPRKRLHPFTDQTVLQKTGFTRTLDRGATGGTNNLLNDQQIQSFITSTVLPHHRTLINSNGTKWSHNQPEKRPTQQRPTTKVAEWNYAQMSPAFGVGNQATKQVFSVPTNVSQGTQRGAMRETQRHPPSFSMGVNVPRETQKEIILIEEGTEDKVCFIPHEISVPQKAQEDFIFIMEETQNDVIYIPYGNSVMHSTHELSYGPKERSVSVSHESQKFNSIPRGNNNSLDEIIMSPRGTSAPQVTQGRPIYLQSPPTDVLSGGLDCKRSQTLETPVQRVPTNDVSAQYQQDALFHHLQPWTMIPQTFPTETEQNLKRIPVQEQFTDTQTDSESLLVNGSRTRDAEMFEHASQFVEVAQDTVNQRPEVENPYNQKITREQIEADLRQIMGELLAETPSTTLQVDEEKQTTEAVGNDTEIQIQDSPDKCRKRKRKMCSRVSSMKRQKVDRETADVTSVLTQDPKAEKKVGSENSQDHDDFVDDALKILRGESSDMFPESIIDQLFKDTFESDIFLTSGDDFAMDPLFFLSPEFDHGVNSLWKD